MAISRVAKTVIATMPTDAPLPLSEVSVKYSHKKRQVTLSIMGLRNRETVIEMRLTETVANDLWLANGVASKIQNQLWEGRLRRAVGELAKRAGLLVAQKESDEPFTLPGYLQRDDRT